MPADVSAQLHAAAGQSGFSIEAVIFVWESYTEVAGHQPPDTPVDTALFCQYVLDRACAFYGRAARQQLRAWSILSWSDLGPIMAALIEAQLARPLAGEVEGFGSLLDLDAALTQSVPPPAARKPFQWSLATIFIFVTVSAIGFAGYGKLGLDGALGTLMAAWIGFVGIFCLQDAFRRRTRGWILFALFGGLLTAIALAMFWSIILHHPETFVPGA